MPSFTSKNILLVGNWRSDVGYAWKMIERFWIAIARAFPDRRTFLCFPELRSLNPEIPAAGIEVIEFSFNFQDPAKLANFCTEHEIGLIYFTDRPYTSKVYRRLRQNGVHRLVIHDHTPGQRTPPTPIRALFKSLNVQLFGADVYIACSEQVKDRLVTIGRIPPARCHLARNGIDLSQFPHQNPTIRQELDLSPEAILAVSCSRLHPYKRVRDIVDAASRTDDLPLHYIHIGDGPEHDSLLEYIHERGLDRRFQLLGQRNDVSKILSGCDIAIHASNGEVGLSLAILEFMAAGLSIAITDEPTVSGIIEHGVTGLKYPHGNATELTAVLRTLARDDTLRRRLGKSARSAVESQYDLSNTVDAVIAAIRGVLVN